MMSRLREKYGNKLSFIYAIIIHIVAFVLLFVSLSLNHRSSTFTETKPTKIIKAVTVNETKVKKEIENIKRKEANKRRAEIAKQNRLKKMEQQIKEQKRQAQLDLEKMKKQQEILKQKEVEQQAEAKKKLEEIKKQQELEQKNLAKLKKQHQEQLANLKKQKAVKKEEERLFKEQLAKEQKQLSHSHHKNLQSDIEKYKTLILNEIGQHWIMPSGINKKLSTLLLIRLAPDGVVLKITLLKSSGDAILDHSVINAIWKASPLPVPTDAKLFEKFRELRLTVKPEGLLT